MFTFKERDVIMEMKRLHELAFRNPSDVVRKHSKMKLEKIAELWTRLYHSGERREIGAARKSKRSVTRKLRQLIRA